MAETIRELWFIHTIAGEYFNHSIKGPMVFVEVEDAQTAVDKQKIPWSVCSWGVGKNLKFNEDIGVDSQWKPLDSDSQTLFKGAIWYQDLREQQTGVKANPVKKAKVAEIVKPSKPKMDIKPKKDTYNVVDTLRNDLKFLGLNPRNIKNEAKLRRMLEAAHQPA